MNAWQRNLFSEKYIPYFQILFGEFCWRMPQDSVEFFLAISLEIEVRI